MTDLLLMHPPVALPCEPPLGAALLAGALRRRGARVTVVDANVEALSFLLASVTEGSVQSTAERRALRGRGRALQQLRSHAGYRSLDRYRGAVRDLSTLLEMACRATPGARVGLADYHEMERSPLSTESLHASFCSSAGSPFAPFFAELAERAIGLAPRVIGLSVNYLHQALPAFALAGALHRRLPDVPLLLGGSLWTAWRERISTDWLPSTMRTVTGDGLSPLLGALGLPMADAPADVAPDYSDLPWDHYLAPARIAPLAASRGCVWRRCHYCPEALTGEAYRPVPPALLPALFDEVRRGNAAELIHLTDSAIPQPALLQLSRQRWSARWYGFARFYPELADAGLCRDLHRAGCVMLQLGLESGSPRVLRRLRKGIDLELASRALHHLAEAGIAVYLYVMFGVPGETLEDAEATLSFVAGHADCIQGMNTSLLNLPVQSPAEPDLHRVPFDEQHDLTLYTGFVHDRGWDRRAARRFVERTYHRHPAIQPILRRTLPVFGANHAPLFLHPGAGASPTPQLEGLAFGRDEPPETLERDEPL